MLFTQSTGPPKSHRH